MTAESVARQLWNAFQAAVDTWQPENVAARFSPDVVYVGTAGYLRGQAELLEYVRGVFAQNQAMHWELEHVDVLLHRPHEAITFAALGWISGRAGGVVQRLPFRVTVLASYDDGDWLIDHFHGSVPIDAFLDGDTAS